MKILSEKIVRTDDYCGTVDIITGIDDFDVTNITFDEATHTYTLNDKILPSVTQILDDGEYDDTPPQQLENARQRGLMVHKEIEEFFKENKMGTSPQFNSFLQIFLDNEAIFNSKSIVDIKTYSDFSATKQLKAQNQLKMYADAIEFCTGEHIENWYVIHLPKSDKARIINMTNQLANVSKQEMQMFNDMVVKMKALEGMIDNMKKDILKGMEENRIYNIQLPNVKITYTSPHEKENFNTKLFKEEEPELYNKYLQKSSVKSSISIKNI